MKYRYEIWTRYFPVYETNDKNKPELFDEFDTIAQVAECLELTPAQVRERMRWSRNGELGGAWHVKLGGWGYQILRFRNVK
jgi:hypothetical protein